MVLVSDRTGPVASYALNANCTDTSYTGWAYATRIEAPKDEWARENDPTRRAAIIQPIQKEAPPRIPNIPLGQFFAPLPIAERS
ncbi:hypothetical protein [Pseudoroseomonas ludipueritiae]|uniref:Uncharacterized protein n=1 Tax=Pseudoroseomonas ludipueritiae TaxID=198093 RepID=A0ABR7R4K7_9PROT|nr:hypothetical protein [Pseudoroseomonas ludipueritiae]MBC9176593.1 hypothetical protein [Pseudoroseomonas ludipueritiae]